jgi:uncharacterized protein YjiS (DUF1127 family)
VVQIVHYPAVGAFPHVERTHWKEIEMTLTDRFADAGMLASRFLERVSAYRDRRATLKALDSCRPRDLKDIGLIRDDVAGLRRGAPEKAIESLSRKASQRAGRW